MLDTRYGTMDIVDRERFSGTGVGVDGVLSFELRSSPRLLARQPSLLGFAGLRRGKQKTKVRRQKTESGVLSYDKLSHKYF